MPTTVISDNTTGSPIGDYTGTDDTSIKEGTATTNYDTDVQIDVSKYAAANHAHTVIRFVGLSNITPPVTVSSVTFGIYLETFDVTSYAIDLRRVLRTWNTAQATWNVYTTGNNWTTAGALSDGNDREASAVAQLPSGVGDLQYHTVTDTGGAFCALVQGWINGTITNDGLHLERNGAGNDLAYKFFTSSEGTNGQRPYLSVTWAASSSSNAKLVKTWRQ